MFDEFGGLGEHLGEVGDGVGQLWGELRSLLHSGVVESLAKRSGVGSYGGKKSDQFIS